MEWGVKTINENIKTNKVNIEKLTKPEKREKPGKDEVVYLAIYFKVVKLKNDYAKNVQTLPQDLILQWCKIN